MSMSDLLFLLVLIAAVQPLVRQTLLRRARAPGHRNPAAPPGPRHDADQWPGVDGVCRHSADILPFSAYRSDPDLARYRGWECPFSVSEAEELSANTHGLAPGTPSTWFQFAIGLLPGAAPIGAVVDYAVAVPSAPGVAGVSVWQVTLR